MTRSSYLWYFTSWLLLISLQMAGQRPDTLLPAKPWNMPVARANFIPSDFTVWVDTSGLAVRKGNWKGKQIMFRNLAGRLQQAIQQVVQQGGGTVQIPKGFYFLDEGVEIAPGNRPAMSVTLNGNGAVLAPTYAGEKALMCIQVICPVKPLRHEVRIEQIQFDGGYFMGSTKDFFNTRKAPPGMAVCGIAALNCRYVHIARCGFRNLYGQAIYIFNQNDQRNTDTSARASYVEVHDNSIFNCWGQQFYVTPNGNFDHYGDGILLSSVAQGAVFNNVVYNDIQVTGYYGRLGIGTDFQTGEVQIVRNRIHGYDRNVHIENSRGGLRVAGNKITGSEMGILIWPFNTQLNYANPLIIENNYISNWGVPKGFSSPRNFAKYSGLINFFSNSPIHNGSVVRGNTLEVDGQSGYELLSDRNPELQIVLVNCAQNEVHFVKNRFRAKNLGARTAQTLIRINGKDGEFSGNELSNMSRLDAKQSKQSANRQIKR